MLNKKFMLITIFIISLLAISAVSASDLDANDEIAINEDISGDMILSDDEFKDSSNALTNLDSYEDNALGDDNSKIKEESNLSDSFSVSGNTFADIQNAIDGANEGDTIELSGTYSGNGSLIKINKPLTILGTGVTVLDANSNSRIFSVFSDNVNLKDLRLINGNSAVYCSGADCSIVNCSFVNCSADDGGAIYCSGADCSIVNCSFVNCSASDYGGGAIFFESGNYSVMACKFMNCTANSDSITYGGGAIYAGWNYCNCSVVNCSFIDNSAKSGGAIFFSYGNYSILDCSFVNNSAISFNYGGCGGAIYSNDNMNIINSSFNQNNANKDGGALYLYSKSNRNYPLHAFIQNSNFTSNVANTSGGAIFNEFALEIESGNFKSNSAQYGGSIYTKNGRVDKSEVTYYNAFGGVSSKETIYYTQQFSLSVSGKSSFRNNMAKKGGAIYVKEDYEAWRQDIMGILNLNGTEFYGNSAVNDDGGSGGAIYGDYMLGNFSLCSFVNNSARSRYSNGGAIDLSDSDCSIMACSFVNNSALGRSESIGGAINFYDCKCFVISSVFVNNSANDSSLSWGGAVYGYRLDGNFSNCNFSGNSALYGGAIYGERLEGIISRCSFNKNHASKDGGLVYIYKSQFYSYTTLNFTMIDNVMESNEPNIYGGLIDLKDNVLSFDTSFSEGNITVKINNKVYKEEIKSNKTSFDLNSIPKGVYNANIHYSGDDDDHNESDLNIPISIESGYKLTSSDLTKYYGGLEKFTVKLTNNNKTVSGEKVNVTVNGKKSTLTTDSKGQASLDISLAPGSYDALSVYNGVSTSSKVTVKSTIDIKNVTGTYLNSKVSATFLNSSGKALANTKVSFKVGSKTYNATTNSNGLATASVDLGVGTYNVTAINPASKEQKTAKLTISKAKSSLAVTSSSSNNVLTLTATVSPSSATGNVVFNVNNKNYTAKISSGKAVQNVTGLNTGNYTVKASYNGDSNFNSSSTTVKVAFKKVIVTKIIYNDMYTGPVPKDAGRIGNYFCVKLVDENNNPLGGLPMEIGFNGRIYNKTTDSNGDARLQINLGYEGAYTFAIGFLGDDERGAAFEVAKIKVSSDYPKPNKANATSSGYELNTSQSKTKIKTSIDYKNMNTKSVIKVEGRAGDDFIVTLLDANKKPLANMPVKIGFNGVIYDKTTDSSGKAQLKINLLYPNTYTFAICYLGDSKYQASFVVAKIKVSKQTPKLNSSSKTFKSSAKTKSLSATLVSMRGKAISGQKLKFTVNGKTYTGKTNAKGVATVNISLNKKGTYSCTVKFAGMTGVSSKSTKISVKIT